MLVINRIRIEIQTEEGLFGFDETFEKKVNLIWSVGNTIGKSSVLSSIFYCLGMEELIGGQGGVVLTPAFKKKLKSNEKEIDVLESKVYLEISNGKNVNTILRSVVHTSRNDSLATVYQADFDSINIPTTLVKDYYIHGPNSATNHAGFFTYLEEFLGADLPYVPTRSENDRKLYLQLVFSGMLIEQKRGWADFFSAMPHFGIPEAKKRVVEYVLGLDTLENEKLKKQILNEERSLKAEWKNLYSRCIKKMAENKIQFSGIPENIEILKIDSKINLTITIDDKVYSIIDYLSYLEKEYNSVIKVVEKNSPNIEKLKAELELTTSNIQELELNILEAQKILKIELVEIKNLESRLSLIDTDINNNRDALKLKDIGSKYSLNIFNDTCPTCNQKIADSVLVSQNPNLVMAIEENINHLKAQKEVFIHTIQQKSVNIKELEIKITDAKQAKSTLEHLSKILKNDIYSLDGSYSESAVYKKITLQNEINKYTNINNDCVDILEEFKVISKKWKVNRASKKSLPSSELTHEDSKKLKSLKSHFISNLEKFDFSSITNFDNITISTETYLPSIDGFDLKFDSSASDYIRGIWSFTIALLQTSLEHNGNHFGLILFDEPGQHSIIKKDINQLFNVLESIDGPCQAFIGITGENNDIPELLEEDDSNDIQGFQVSEKAFKRLN
ncbi:hypothetical protein ACQKND_04005 [Viridibacillus arvi]|uniref:hypothetical protein n=1 Tax=Viridibacillus arvi TaxID=263475 RepID=UPI003D090096